MHVTLTCRDGSYRRHDFRVGRLLEHVPARTRLERRADVPRVVLHREDENARLGHGLQHRGHALDAALLGHHQVHQHDVGLAFESPRTPHGRRSGPRRPSRCRLRRPEADAGPTARLHGRPRKDSNHGSGTSALSIVPAPSLESIAIRPPRSATRSRIPTSPRPPSRTTSGSNPRHRPVPRVPRTSRAA